MKKHEGQQSAAKRGRQIATRIAKSGEKVSHAPEFPRCHEGAGAKKIVFTPPRHDIAKVNDAGKLPAAIALGHKKILRDVLSRENHVGIVEWDKSHCFSSKVIKLIKESFRQSQTSMA